MTSTESETIQTNEPITEKIDRRKIKRAPWRTTVLEDGTLKYNDKPNDPHYHRKYWHAKRKDTMCSKINCEICGASISKAHLLRRKQTTKKCVEMQNQMRFDVLE